MSADPEIDVQFSELSIIPSMGKAKTFPMLFIYALFLSFFATLVAGQAALDPIVIKGSRFFYKTNGTQFIIKGVSYQQNTTGSGLLGAVDPLADESACKRDIPYLTQLRANVIHVYTVSPTLDHAGCMNAFAAAGIYVIADLSSPTLYINRTTPAWNNDLFTAYSKVIDSMQGYNNVLGFFVGSEVFNTSSTSVAAAFVKAAVRDMKTYIQLKNYRSIGVGYNMADDTSDITTGDSTADYLTGSCGVDTGTADFLGMVKFSWCGESSIAASGYDKVIDHYSNYSVPLFFAEYGCNDPSPRTFSEINAIFGPQMSGFLSGGIVYQYQDTGNTFGLVSVSGNSVSVKADFTAYSSQIASASPSLVAASDYTATNSPAACPTNSNWGASPKLAPLALDQGLCSCMMSSLSCVAATQFNDSMATSLISSYCGSSGCSGLGQKGDTGAYDAYSICNGTERVSWALNWVYKNSPNQCANDKNAVNRTTTSIPSTCTDALSQAGTSGLGTVSSFPSPIKLAATSTSNPTSGASGSSKTSSGSGAGAANTGQSVSGGSNSSAGLSAGAKAGIAIGVIAIAGLVVGLGFFCRKRKRSANSKGISRPSSPDGLEVGDAPAGFGDPRTVTELPVRKEKHELSGQGESNRYSVPTELPSNTPTGPRHSELDGHSQPPLPPSELSNEPTTKKTSPSSLSVKPAPEMSRVSASWSNTPWSEPQEGFLPSASSAAANPPTRQSITRELEDRGVEVDDEDPDELQRLMDEERRIDEAILESERIQKLRQEKEELQKKMAAARKKTNHAQN